MAVLTNSTPLPSSMRDCVARTLTSDAVRVAGHRGAELDVSGGFDDAGVRHLLIATLLRRDGQYELLSVNVQLLGDARRNWRWDVPLEPPFQDVAPPNVSLGAGSWTGSAGAAPVNGVPNTGLFPLPMVASDVATQSSGLAPGMSTAWWHSETPAATGVGMMDIDPPLDDRWADPLPGPRFVSLADVESGAHGSGSTADFHAAQAGIPTASAIASPPADMNDTLLAHGYTHEQVKSLSWAARKALSNHCQKLLAKGFTHRDLLKVARRNSPLLHEFAASIDDWQERFPTADLARLASLLSGFADEIREKSRQPNIFRLLRRLPNDVTARVTPEQLCMVAKHGNLVGFQAFARHFESLTEIHGYDAAQVTAVAANYLGDKALPTLARLHGKLSTAPLYLTHQQLASVAATKGGGSALEALAQHGPELARRCTIDQIMLAATGQDTTYGPRAFASGRDSLEALRARYP